MTGDRTSCYSPRRRQGSNGSPISRLANGGPTSGTIRRLLRQRPLVFFTQFVLLDLPRRRHRVFRDEAYVLRDFELRQRLGAERDEFANCNRAFRPHRSRDRFAEEFVGDSVDVGVGDGGMFAEAILNLFRRDVLAAADDDVLDATRDPYVPVGVETRLVTRVEPAVI